MESLRTPMTGKNELGESVRLIVITRHISETTKYETTMWGRAVVGSSPYKMHLAAIRDVENHAFQRSGKTDVYR
jgi:hypothetical protein